MADKQTYFLSKVETTSDLSVYMAGTTCYQVVIENNAATSQHVDLFSLEGWEAAMKRKKLGLYVYCPFEQTTYQQMCYHFGVNGGEIHQTVIEVLQGYENISDLSITIPKADPRQSETIFAGGLQPVYYGYGYPALSKLLALSITYVVAIDRKLLLNIPAKTTIRLRLFPPLAYADYEQMFASKAYNNRRVGIGVKNLSLMWRKVELFDALNRAFKDNIPCDEDIEIDSETPGVSYREIINAIATGTALPFSASFIVPVGGCDRDILGARISTKDLHGPQRHNYFEYIKQDHGDSGFSYFSFFRGNIDKHTTLRLDIGPREHYKIYFHQPLAVVPKVKNDDQQLADAAIQNRK